MAASFSIDSKKVIPPKNPVLELTRFYPSIESNFSAATHDGKTAICSYKNKGKHKENEDRATFEPIPELKMLEKLSDEERAKAIKAILDETDKEMVKIIGDSVSGTTHSVQIVFPKNIYNATAGDSAGLMISIHKQTKKVSVVRISRCLDHIPKLLKTDDSLLNDEEKAEKKRIAQLKQDKKISERNRLNNDLNVSRGFGDSVLIHYGLLSETHFGEVKVDSDSLTFSLLVTDGVLDFFNTLELLQAGIQKLVDSVGLNLSASQLAEYVVLTAYLGEESRSAKVDDTTANAREVTHMWNPVFQGIWDSHGGGLSAALMQFHYSRALRFVARKRVPSILISNQLNALAEMYQKEFPLLESPLNPSEIMHQSIFFAARKNRLKFFEKINYYSSPEFLVDVQEEFKKNILEKIPLQKIIQVMNADAGEDKTKRREFGSFINIAKFISEQSQIFKDQVSLFITEMFSSYDPTKNLYENLLPLYDLLYEKFQSSPKDFFPIIRNGLQACLLLMETHCILFKKRRVELTLLQVMNKSSASVLLKTEIETELKKEKDEKTGEYVPYDTKMKSLKELIFKILDEHVQKGKMDSKATLQTFDKYDPKEFDWLKQRMVEEKFFFDIVSVEMIDKKISEMGGVTQTAAAVNSK